MVIDPPIHVMMDSKSTRLQIAAAGSAFSMLAIILGLTAPFVVLKTPLPYMATPRHKIQKALEFLRVHNNHRTGGGIFVDLGSGDGEVIYQALQMGCFTKIVGYELNWTLWGISQLRRLLFWGKGRKHTEIRLGDFFQTCLPNDTSTVMVFGVTPLMKPLSAKLARETRVGVHVLSYRFPLPLKDESNRDLLKAKLVYDEEEMRIYEVIEKNDESSF
jgi:hypothetical protein